MQIKLFPRLFRISWLVLLLFQPAIITYIYPQTPERDELFGFVSRLSAEVVGKNINLTWIPSVDLKNSDPNSSAFIYRSEQKITTNNLSFAQYMDTKLNTDGKFEDISPNPGKYYYGVILMDSNYKRYENLIPYRNQTTKVVTINTDQSKTIDFPSNSFPQNDPILLKESSETFEPGRVTLISIKENPSVDYSNNFRETPLPYLRVDHRVQINSAPLPVDPIIDAVPGWKPAPPNTIKKQLNNSTETAISSLATQSHNSLTTNLKPEILSIDENISKESPDYTLQLIIHQKLLRGKFEESGRLLMDYLALNHSKETESRIHFYLGQSLFFQNNFSKALIEFLFSENDFKLASAYWIDKTLNEIKKN